MHEVSDANSGVTVLVLSDPGSAPHAPRQRRSASNKSSRASMAPRRLMRRAQFLGISDADTLEFSAITTLREDYDDIDAVLILTEMPQRSHGKPEIAKIYPEKSTAALSYPTLGVLAGKRRLVSLFMSCVLRLVDGAPSGSHERYELRGHRWLEPSGGAPGFLLAPSITGVPRTVLGLVATNAPWRTAPKLSTTLAAAAAAGAFGIFYNSICRCPQPLTALPTHPDCSRSA